MPIAPELRHFYRTKDWLEVRIQVLERADRRCEWCGKPRGLVVVARDGSGRWKPFGDRDSFPVNDRPWRWPPPSDALSLKLSSETLDSLRQTAPPPRNVALILSKIGVAHLKHNPGHDDPLELAALCQRCHLVYDQPEHRRSYRLRRDRETGQLRLELVA